MIVKMTKYNFVLLKAQHEAFLSKIQDLGLIDVTTTGWEPTDADRELLSMIDKHKSCIAQLSQVASGPEFSKVDAFDSGADAFVAYVDSCEKTESTKNLIQRSLKELEELKIWGDFLVSQLEELDKSGIKLSFFYTYRKEFQAQQAQWSEDYTVVPMNPESDTVYFVVVSSEGQTVEVNAQQVKAPTMNYTQKKAQIEALEAQLIEYAKELDKCASSLDLIKDNELELQAQLQYSQVHSSAKSEAEGALVVMEAWATVESSAKVDELLESYPDMIYLKGNPTLEDQTPVLLKNNKFSRIFELIGAFYALPKYGTLDLTAFLGPFYMIFFGFCLCDGGYGLIFVLAGLFMKLKGGESMSQVSSLTMLCGAATMLFGVMTGSFFGIAFAELPAFASFREYILTPDKLFSLAIGIGIFQVLVAMTLKVVTISIQFGVKYALAPIGWMIVIISSLGAMFLPDLGVSGFSMDSIAYQICAGIGLILMLFLNNPDKNPLANFGAGLWNTYNDVTGLLGDILSYIRLFAIGLSGSILALVFNDLAVGMSPDIPVLGFVVTLFILLAGHGINLFMSSLSSFVHPLRLTFVEFYKNAGFESTPRAFTPFKHEKK